jgi:hypothetical protein
MFPPIEEEKSASAGKTCRPIVAGAHFPPHRHDFQQFASLTKFHRKCESKFIPV